MICRLLLSATIAVAVATNAVAEEIPATPDNYRKLLGRLEPGDVLELSPGTYPRLTLREIHGTPEDWITVTGPAEGEPAIIVSEAGHNTVQIYGCSFLAIKNLTVDVRGLPVDAINAKRSVSHHILIANNVLRGFPENRQQIVGISTKSTAFHWTIRGNTINEAGTGLYLGNSDGSAPFIAGVIENNVVIKPVGYCMEIKRQNPYQMPEGLEPEPHATIVRNNVFIKDDRKSPDGDRPSLLVGGFPQEGPGSRDHYEICGNLFYHNPRESLFQGCGRLLIHNNTFVGTGDGQTAVMLMPHAGVPVVMAHVHDNRFCGSARGIRFSAAAQESGKVSGNVFISVKEPVSGHIEWHWDNVAVTQRSGPDGFNLDRGRMPDRK